MRTLIFCALLLSPFTAAQAQEPLVRPATDVVLDDLIWTHRPLIVFADSPNDPAFIEQLELIEARAQALQERDVLVLVDTDPKELSAARKTLRPRGFMLVLIGKDGGVKLRKPFPWDAREISRVIDKMPIRQREIREALE
jgi:hypothetical protein